MVPLVHVRWRRCAVASEGIGAANWAALKPAPVWWARSQGAGEAPAALPRAAMVIIGRLALLAA
jgi:hypothetical protein